MAYVKQTWVNGAGGGTPLSAARLNHIEDGIDALSCLAAAMVAPATGVAATDTAAVQAALDAAAITGGRVVLTSGDNYVVTGVSIDTGVFLDLNWGGLTLNPGANTYLIATKDYDALISGDTTSGPRDWGILNGYLDGGKTGQTATDKPVLAIYGRRYVLNNLTIRNGKGAGIRSKWSTSSPFLVPNGFESFITDLYIHSCDGDGLTFEGPHDAYFQNFFIVKCAESASAVPLHLPDDSGRTNGSNFDKFHIYGGNGYNYGAVLNSSGCKFTNFVIEGSQLAQVLIQASQIQILGAHLYPGSIADATVKGITVGDASHPNLNGLTIHAKIENCGGGGFDFTYMGDNNVIDGHIYYYEQSPAPTLPSLGYVGTPTLKNRIALYVAGPDYLPTTQNLSSFIGPLRLQKATATDTQALLDLRNEGGGFVYGTDHHGRPQTGDAGPYGSVVPGAATGTGGEAYIDGPDPAHKLTFFAGTDVTAGKILTVTFGGGAYVTAPRAVMVTPRSSACAALGLFTPLITTTGFELHCSTAPAVSTWYDVSVLVVGA